ncbi:hypothetical protein C8J56DRAFT_1020020 [Mycena floridula]|nr:hypothetical protein C8J56DRAFT_1020020 [Mycena floridula]
MLLVKVFLSFIVAVFALRSAERDFSDRSMASRYIPLGIVVDGVTYATTFKARQHDMDIGLDDHPSNTRSHCDPIQGSFSLYKKTTVKDVVEHEVKLPPSRPHNLGDLVVYDSDIQTCLFLQQGSASVEFDRPSDEKIEEKVLIIGVHRLQRVWRFSLTSVSVDVLWKSLPPDISAWTCLGIRHAAGVQQQLMTCLIPNVGLVIFKKELGGLLVVVLLSDV